MKLASKEPHVADLLLKFLNDHPDLKKELQNYDMYHKKRSS